MKQTRKRRILIVDDSEMNREILTGILEDEYDIVEAEDGKKAIAIMEEGLYSFSIVLLDITMPELDGFGVLQVMQQRNWLKELPVIIISAETSNEYIGHAYEMGVSDYFSRPFDARIVNTRVRNTIALFERDYIDQVTGGGNRKEFIRRVSRSLKEMPAKTDYVLLFFNIKNFKAVNELLGVGGGDKLLCWFYQRIIYSRFAPIDTSRIESDHFACLIEARNLDYDYLTEFCNFNYGKEKRKIGIENVKFFKQYVILKFKGIDNINDVLAYKGSSLMVTRENAVKLNKDEYFIADLIGLHVSDDENKLEGKLVDVLETGANDVYVIALSDGRELLLPAIRECVLSVDLQAQEMKIHVLEGLLDEHKN